MCCCLPKHCIEMLLPLLPELDIPISIDPIAVWDHWLHQVIVIHKPLVQDNMDEILLTLSHKIFIEVGHDEVADLSAEIRANGRAVNLKEPLSDKPVYIGLIDLGDGNLEDFPEVLHSGGAIIRDLFFSPIHVVQLGTSLPCPSY